MVNSLFSKGDVVRILSSEKQATVLSILSGVDKVPNLAYIIETDDILSHHCLSFSEIELINSPKENTYHDKNI